MNILIRCDIGENHGMGHAVRMRALAQELAARGCNIAFISNTPERLASFVAPFSCTHAATVALQPTSKDYGSADVGIVDTKYPIEEAWYRGFGDALGSKIVRIDHPRATPESCDLLVGPGAHWSPETVSTLRTSFGDRFLYGWDYVMLTPEVMQQQPIPYAQRVDGPIVFCAGGSDPSGALAKMVKWCGGMVKTTDWFFLIPAQTLSIFPQCIWAHLKPFNREYLRRAALVVSTFGVTCYECLWYQTPLLILAHTEENRMGAFYLENATPAVRFCDALALTNGQEYFCQTVEEYWQWGKGRTAKHHAAAGLIDGRGTERVAEAILRL